MGKLKIVFCTNGVFPEAIGGMQRHSRLLIDELSCDTDTELLVFHPHQKKLFTRQNVKEVTIPKMDPSKNYLLERYRYSKRIYSHLQSLSDHIIYSQGPSVWYKAKDFKSRLIINPHGLEPFQGITAKEKLAGFPFRKIYKSLFKKARYVVSLGGGLTDILKSTIDDENKIVILPNAVEKPDIQTIDKNQKINNPIKALFVGRFATNKGIHILMETIAKLNRQGFEDDIEFFLAGKGPLYEKYKKSNSHKNVHILGFVSDEELEDLYKSSVLFILPTLFEGMPTVVLEAMSRSMPVIVSDVGATAELVSSSNGYLIQKNNSDQLKKSITHFLGLSNDEKRELGKNSLIKVREQFTWSKVAQKHIKLFKRLQADLEDSV